MNYLLMFTAILVILVFMFTAGYTVAYKRFSGSLARMQARLADQSRIKAVPPRLASLASCSEPTAVAVAGAQQAAPGRKRSQG